MSKFHLVINGKDKGIICASAWLRLANYFIDSIGLAIFFGVVSLFSSLVLNKPIPAFTWQPMSASFYLNLFLRLAAGLIYYISFEGLYGRTPGKWVTGTLVVNDKGLRPRWMPVVGRSFARYIPFDVFSFIGEEPQGWHDSVSNTFVVKTRESVARTS